MRKLFYISVFLFMCLIGLVLGCVLMLTGCETPYGTLSADAIDDYIRRSDDRLVCLSDGFDTICIKTVPGPRGRDGKDGNDGRDGAIVTLAVESVVVETVREVFVVHVRRTDMTYQTRLGEIYVPEDAPVVAPEGVVVSAVTENSELQTDPTTENPVDSGLQPDPTTENPVDSGLEPDPTRETDPTTEIPPTGDTDSDEIWHVMYRNDGGVVTVYVYPRCFNNPYHDPPRPECDHGVDASEFYDVLEGYDHEMQGTQADVQYLLEQALSEVGGRLVSVGGVQGIVN